MSAAPINPLAGFSQSEISGVELTSSPKFELAWQDLRFCARYVDDKEWSNAHVPAFLHQYPENSVISEQLQQILAWSLQTPEHALVASSKPAQKFDTVEDVSSNSEDTPLSLQHDLPTRSNTVIAVPKSTADHVPDTLVRAKSQKTFSLVTRLQQLRGDVARKKSLKIPSNTSNADLQASSSKGPVADVQLLGECISCFDEFPKYDLVHLACSHDYCRPCLREVVFTAMKNEAAFPPKCCLTEIPLKTVLVCLDKEQRDDYREKSAEYAIPAGHRWYCPEPRCSRWIRPESLQRERRTQQTCPHCKAGICSMCRSLAHDTNQDCPQDFGLESTLEIAESEGWRRCYSCRTMVELTVGCRHITCRCGAEFCYVCNARWRTCRCTEADKERRIQELRVQRENRAQMQEEERRRREEEDEAARLEAEEMAEAIRQVEEMERQDAIRKVEEENRRQLEEELALALLEEARLVEEIARREEEEEAERQFREILIASSKEECQAMMRTLMQIINYQHATLMSNHVAHEQSINEEMEFRKHQQITHCATMTSWLQENVNLRTSILNTRHQSEWEALLLQAENEEDEMFMHMHIHLRGKPNREQREKKMRDTLRQQQYEKTDQLQRRQHDERQRLETGTRYEFEGLRLALGTRLEPIERDFHNALQNFGGQVGCERRWLQSVSTRRINMLNEHKKIVLQQLEAEEDPTGLNEDQARSIRPLLSGADDTAAGSSVASPRRSHQIESADLYGAGPEGAIQDSLQAESKPLSRSNTVVRSVPGAFPNTSESQPSSPTSNAPRPNPYIPVSSTSTNSTSTNSTTSPIPIPTTPQAIHALSPTTTAMSKHSSLQSNSSASASASTSSKSASIHSSDTDTSILDTIPSAVIARHSVNLGQSQSQSHEDKTKGKGKAGLGSVFRGFGKRKELSEDEIRRRMSRAGAGDAGWGALMG